MKRIATIFLALSLTFTLIVPNALAASADQETVRQTIQVLGILTGDENGNLNLSGYVTRAQFAKMMIAASVYRDAVSETASLSPFRDVKSTHWAASYIQTAVSAGWLTGYSDGTYRPDNHVKLEEAVSAVLKMLGYTAADFSGSFPEAQLAKYSALKLDENITKTKGQYLSRQDCMNLFYNLMGVNTTGGIAYAAKLGYSINNAGELDYSSLVQKDMKGPYIVKDTAWLSSLPFAAGMATVYRNGAVSSPSEVSPYDVYYYNANLRTVWVYRNHVTGVYTAAAPSTAAPTSVTVAGTSYKLATSSAAYALSDMGVFSIGDTVTLLLGQNGEAVGVLSANAINATLYGIVVGTGTQSYTDSTGLTSTVNMVSVACTDGSTYQYPTKSNSFAVGNLIQVSLSGGETSITRLSDKSLSGKVNAAATSIGPYAFADGIQILETTKNGAYAIVHPSRLAGLTLSNDSIRYYVLDGKGRIRVIILNDVTGDLYDYGIITDVKETEGNMSTFGSYQYIVDGKTASYSASKVFGVKTGPAQFEFSGSSVVRMRNLAQLHLTAINSLYAQSNSTHYRLSDYISVYLYKDGNYSLTNLSSVSNLENYSLSGYYNAGEGSDAQIRVIVAREK